MTIKYVVLNGPLGSGKSTIGRMLTEEFKVRVPKVTQDYFAAPMKHFISTALGEKYQDMNKEKARPELNGYSVRQFMIHLSEEVMKPRYGDDCFARWLTHRVLKSPQDVPNIVIIDDLGFEVELHALDNVYLVRVERAGHDFKGDSRGFCGVPNYTLTNNGNLRELRMNVARMALAIVEWCQR